jgi:hypothetical protein
MSNIALHDYVERRLREDPRYRDRRHLAHHEHQAFSQSGEDGVLREIFRRAGSRARTFVEFGAARGWGNNTLLSLQAGWSGAWLEADPGRCRSIRRDFASPIAEGRLTVRQAFLNAENVEEELTAAGAAHDVDLMSIDVDGNDYWLWQRLSAWSPRVVVIEYNAIYPPDVEWVMPYAPAHRWDGGSWFGASLKSLELLGRELGYHLVGCTLAGTNAFFVRKDLVDEESFLSPFTAEQHHEPPRYFLLGVSGHPRRPAPPR